MLRIVVIGWRRITASMMWRSPSATCVFCIDAIVKRIWHTMYHIAIIVAWRVYLVCIMRCRIRVGIMISAPTL